MTKEERAIEYAKARYGNNGKETQNEIAKVIACRVGYEAGWDEAIQNLWIDVRDRLPKKNEKVLVLFKYEGMLRIDTDVYFGESFYKIYDKKHGWSFGGNKILAWMPIPPFDKILNDNK